MKLHIKVIQRNGVDIFITSSMKMKPAKRLSHSTVAGNKFIAAQSQMNGFYGSIANRAACEQRKCNPNKAMINQFIDSFSGWWSR